MRQTLQFLALVASLTSSVSAAGAVLGFNYGSTGPNGIRSQADFEEAFATAKALTGTDEKFTSARLYTMIQGGTTSDVTAAIPAAIKQGTTLLLGLWASGGGIDNEIAALSAAIAQYGDDFASLVEGISVGSEDLYRNGVTGIAAGSTVGADPDVLVDAIKKTRKAIAGTALSKATIGHVDTWDAWTNGTNAEVIDNCDWLGFDTYPYWQKSDGNDISNAKKLFVEAYDKVNAVAGGKEIWVTETGWAVTDDKGGEGDAKPSTANAKKYWDAIGCEMLFGLTNTWWYTLSETGSTPNFGVSTSDDSTTPFYDLSCDGITAQDISQYGASTASNNKTSTASGSLSTSTGSSNSTSGSGSNSSVTTGSPSGATGGSSSGGSSTGSGSGSSASGTSDQSAGALNLVSVTGVLAAAAMALIAAL